MFWVGLGLLAILVVLAVMMCISSKKDKTDDAKKSDSTETPSEVKSDDTTA